MMITLAAVVTGINAEAQRRDSRSSREIQKHEKNYQAERRQSREYKKSNKDFKASKRQNYHANRNYKNDYNERRWDRDDHGKYAERHWDNDCCYNNRYEYNHPRYGHVYRRFNSNPIRLRYNHGNIFFFAGNYYRYYRGVGYVRIAIPRNVVFYDLPFRCELVRVGPQVYYRHGNLVFERCDRGYRLAPAIDIRLSAHF